MSFISRALSNIWSNPVGQYTLVSLGGAAMGAIGGACLGYGLDSKIINNSFEPAAATLTSTLSGATWAVNMYGFPIGNGDFRRVCLRLTALFACIFGGGTASWGICQALKWNTSYCVSLWIALIGPIAGINALALAVIFMNVDLGKWMRECYP